MNDVLPTYVEPCLSDRRSSLESVWLYASDFGECYPPQSDSLIFPRLVPVYNGKVLDIDSELVHESLSGISIKHYSGKCYKEEEEVVEEEERAFYGENGEGAVDWGLFDDFRRDSTSYEKKVPVQTDSYASGSVSGTFAYRQSEDLEGQPICTLPKINYRNSFWNIHRPELCKLTWGQKYVGVTLITEHLHEHLLHHGSLCAGFHTQEERDYMLNKELDEYVRLKVLVCPRELPPDEPLFNFKNQHRVSEIILNPKCKNVKAPQVTYAINYNERYIEISDEEEDHDSDGIIVKNVRRSNEEFCLTIGKHVRKPPIVQSESIIPEGYITPEILPCGGEEVGGLFYFNWLLYHGEESFAENSEKVETQSTTISEEEPEIEPCPPLIMDEFCKAAGKIAFSDVRCDPDF